MPERVRPLAPRAAQPAARMPASRGIATEPRPAGHQAILRAALAGRLAPAHVLQLQRSIGNGAVGRLLSAARSAGAPAVQREETAPAPEPPGGEMTDAQGDQFEALLGSMSDAEIDAAFEMLEREEDGALAEPPVTASAPEAADGGVPSIQRGKSLLASNNADITLANLLEGNTSKRPRLVPRKRWNAIKKKHRLRGYRKYAGILHQNLTNNAGTEDLVLLVRLKRRALIGSLNDLHYEEIEKKARKKRQTAQTRTELLGEVVATIRMEGYSGGNAQLLIGYASGAGIDQLWVDHTTHTYYVVEAKGPGAKLKVDRFAVRGATGAPLKQMSDDWVKDRIPRLATKNNAVLQQLLTRCGLRVRHGALEDDPGVVGTYTLRGLVITASWNETTGELNSGLSNRTYTF